MRKRPEESSSCPPWPEAEGHEGPRKAPHQLEEGLGGDEHPGKALGLGGEADLEVHLPVGPEEDQGPFLGVKPQVGVEGVGASRGDDALQEGKLVREEFLGNRYVHCPTPPLTAITTLFLKLLKDP